MKKEKDNKKVKKREIEKKDNKKKDKIRLKFKGALRNYINTKHHTK